MLCGLKTSRNRLKQRVRPKRLLQAADRTELCRHGQEVGTGGWVRSDRAAGDHNDLDQRVPLPNHPHRLKPVHARHEDVEEQQVESSDFELIDPLPAAAGDDDLVSGPLQQEPDGNLNGLVIVHDQDFRQGRFFQFNRSQRQVAEVSLNRLVSASASTRYPPLKSLWQGAVCTVAGR